MSDLKKRVLLLGGAGTLGSDILSANLQNYDFFVVDNFADSTLNESELSELCQYQNVNVADQVSINNIFETFKPDVVVYLATTLSNNQQFALNSNVIGMKNAITAAERIGFPRIIYVQSFLTRNCDHKITTNTPVEAKDPYATWKLAAEYLLQEYSGPKTTLILASVLSPRLTIGAIPAFTKRILEKQPIKVTDTYRDYLNPKSFILGLTNLMESNEALEVLVLGSGHAISTHELLKLTAKNLNKNMNQIDFELIDSKKSDSKKITLDPKWRQSFMSSEENIEECVTKIVRQLQQFKGKVRSHH